MNDKRWKHSWQVIRLFPDGALAACCSHRWAITADWCADWRDRIFVIRERADGSYHDVRSTPER